MHKFLIDNENANTAPVNVLQTKYFVLLIRFSVRRVHLLVNTSLSSNYISKYTNRTFFGQQVSMLHNGIEVFKYERGVNVIICLFIQISVKSLWRNLKCFNSLTDNTLVC